MQKNPPDFGIVDVCAKEPPYSCNPNHEGFIDLPNGIKLSHYSRLVGSDSFSRGGNIVNIKDDIKEIYFDTMYLNPSDIYTFQHL